MEKSAAHDVMQLYGERLEPKGEKEFHQYEHINSTQYTRCERKTPLHMDSILVCFFPP